MHNSANALIVTSHRLKKLTGYTLCLLFLTWAGWSGCERLMNPERPKGAAHSRMDITTRALRIGNALNGTTRLLSPPVFLLEPSHRIAKDSSFYNVWIVLCESGNQQINMVFDDRSGRVSCLVMNYAVVNQERKSLLPPVKTPAEATAIAVERLKALEVLPPHAQIALQETPEKKDEQNVWETKWLVRTSPGSQPYGLKLSINKRTGLPTRMIDMHTTL